MAQIKFVRPEEPTYVRVSDMYDASSGERKKIPPEELHGQEVGYFFPGSEDELQLFEVRCDPNVTFNSHAHDEDEIMYVLGGEIILGRRRYPPGSAIYIPGKTLYSFRSGPQGLRFLNFRPRQDVTYITRDELQEQRKSNGKAG